jgi:hypothetical protein
VIEQPFYCQACVDSNQVAYDEFPMRSESPPEVVPGGGWPFGCMHCRIVFCALLIRRDFARTSGFRLFTFGQSDDATDEEPVG